MPHITGRYVSLDPLTTELQPPADVVATFEQAMLDHPHMTMAEDIRSTGNKVLHRSTVTMNEAGDCVAKLRALMEHLYMSDALNAEDWPAPWE